MGRSVVQSPEEFWAEEKEKEHEHICEFSLEELRERHKEELKTIESERDAVTVGIKLMGDYYQDGFSSRSCSRRMAELVGHGTSYLDFYGSSSEYYYLRREVKAANPSFYVRRLETGYFLMLVYHGDTKTYYAENLQEVHHALDHFYYRAHTYLAGRERVEEGLVSPEPCEQCPLCREVYNFDADEG